MEVSPREGGVVGLVAGLGEAEGVVLAAAALVEVAEVLAAAVHRGDGK